LRLLGKLATGGGSGTDIVSLNNVRATRARSILLSATVTRFS
jgi:hypothetical protein